eukprot:g44925.t1
MIITGKTNKKHLKNMDIVLRPFSQVGICLRTEKYVFQARHVIYSGYRVNKTGLHSLEDEVRVIKGARSHICICGSWSCHLETLQIHTVVLRVGEALGSLLIYGFYEAT